MLCCAILHCKIFCTCTDTIGPLAFITKTFRLFSNWPLCTLGFFRTSFWNDVFNVKSPIYILPFVKLVSKPK